MSLENQLTTKNLLWLGCLILLIVTLYIVSTDYTHRHDRAKIYDSFMTQTNGIKLDKFGKPYDQLRSPLIRHYAQKDRMTAQTPYFVFHKNHSPAWYVSADHGEGLQGNKIILLTGHVKIWQPPGPGSKNTTFLTSKAYLFPDKSLATTNQPITIEQPGSVLHGVGLNADLKKGKIDILSQTEGMYGKNSQD